MSDSIPKDIREQIIRRIKEGGVSAAQVAREHGVNPKTVYGWLSRGTLAEPGAMEANRLRRENQTLYAIVGKLHTEIEKLKRGRS